MDDFSALYRRWIHEVTRWARALGAAERDLDDVAQEVFLLARRKLRDFDGRNPSAWLYRMTAGVVANHRRRSWFRHVLHGNVERDPGERADLGPEELLARKEHLRLFERLLQRMSLEHREVFVLFEIEGYTSAEIAALLGIPEGTVRTRLHHARKRFLKLIAGLMRGR